MAFPSKQRWKENRDHFKDVFNPIFKTAPNRKDPDMLSVKEGDILTKITRYNLIRNQRLIYIDVHETKAGRLAGKFVAVPNLINIVAKQDFQGTGQTESEALENCLQKIKSFEIEDLFPKKE